MFKFNPISAEESLRMQQPFPEGEYEFVADICEQKMSQGGNNMIIAHITIYSPNGKSLSLKDYMLPEHEQMRYRWRQFCESVGLTSQYESGEINLDSIRGMHGRCMIKHEKEQNGERMFCKVKSYLKPSENKTEDHPFNDDIAF